MKSIFCTAILFAGLVSSAWGNSNRAGFTIAFQGVETDLTLMAATVMPNEILRVQTTAEASSEQGLLRREGKEWLWTAPDQPGRSEIVFFQNNQSINLQVFILTPFQNGKQDGLNGYRIGRYASELFRGLSSYSAPKGFIDLSHGPEDLRISPHFTLGQFICKQQPGHDPSYLLIRPELLIKLETLLEAAVARGWAAPTLYVMSGFRTPHYNRSIGNNTTTSRHLYGGAADVWIDGDGDGMIDDLNGDGRITRDDARALAQLAESLAAKGGRNWPSGGLSVYSANAAHGPFIHVDARGYKARW